MYGKNIRIVVMGSLLYDCVVWADRLPKKGETVIGYRNGFFSGGKGANQAVQAAKLGAEVYMIGKVGRDKEGEFLIENLRRNGVKTDFISIDDNNSTGTCCIHVDKNGDNAIVIAPQACVHVENKNIDDAQDLIRTADIFLTQLEINLPATEYGLRMAKKWNRTTILNPAPPHSIPAEIFKYADYITPNETETEFFTGIEQNTADTETWCREAGRKLSELGPGHVVITLGKKGAYYSSGSLSRIYPTFNIPAADTTAAGDAFNAAMAVKIGEGAGIEEVMRFANAAGSLAASKCGAQVSMANRAEVEELVKNGVLNR